MSTWIPGPRDSCARNAPARPLQAHRSKLRLFPGRENRKPPIGSRARGWLALGKRPRWPHALTRLGDSSHGSAPEPARLRSVGGGRFFASALGSTARGARHFRCSCPGGSRPPAASRDLPRICIGAARSILRGPRLNVAAPIRRRSGEHLGLATFDRGAGRADVRLSIGPRKSITLMRPSCVHDVARGDIAVDHAMRVRATRTLGASARCAPAGQRQRPASSRPTACPSRTRRRCTGDFIAHRIVDRGEAESFGDRRRASRRKRARASGDAGGQAEQRDSRVGSVSAPHARAPSPLRDVVAPTRCPTAGHLRGNAEPTCVRFEPLGVSKYRLGGRHRRVCEADRRSKRQRCRCSRVALQPPWRASTSSRASARQERHPDRMPA